MPTLSSVPEIQKQLTSGGYRLDTNLGSERTANFIQTLINQQIKGVLDELEKGSTHYTADGLVVDGLDTWAVSVATIQKIRSRYE